MPGPSASAHQVLVYSGPGVSALSLSHTVLTLSLLLLPHYTVQPASPQLLATEPWEPSCALLVIPGGRDLPFVDELSVKTKVTRRIKEYVEEGGRYLGICAGAYFGAEEVRFDQGGGLEVVGKRDLVSDLCSLPQAARTDLTKRASFLVHVLVRRTEDSNMLLRAAPGPSRSFWTGRRPRQWIIYTTTAEGISPLPGHRARLRYWHDTPSLQFLERRARSPRSSLGKAKAKLFFARSTSSIPSTIRLRETPLTSCR